MTAPRDSLKAAFHKVTGIFLPAGYPETVHPHYLPFTFWNFLQSCSGSMSGVLTTQCLLYGLGLSSSSSTSVAIGGTIALAATLNWVLKDGLGQVGGVLFVALIGSRFDREAKRYRFLATAMFKLAGLLEMLVPLMPKYFVLVASLANVAKNVGWMATSATRAQIHRYLAGSHYDNLGDITGKTASQNTFASVLGTALGVLFSTIFVMRKKEEEILEPLEVVKRCFRIAVPLAAVGLFSSYQSCRYAVSPKLSLLRLQLILRPLFNKKTTRGIISRLENQIPTPEALCLSEPFLLRPRSAVLFEPLISKYTDRISATVKDFATLPYVLVADSKTRQTAIWFRADENISTVDMFEGILASHILNSNGEIGEAIATAKEITSPLIAALSRKGWDVSSLSLPHRRPITFINDKSLVRN